MTHPEVKALHWSKTQTFLTTADYLFGGGDEASRYLMWSDVKGENRDWMTVMATLTHVRPTFHCMRQPVRTASTDDSKRFLFTAELWMMSGQSSSPVAHDACEDLGQNYLKADIIQRLAIVKPKPNTSNGH